MFSFADKFEDPAHPLLGPTLWGLQTWGLWQPRAGLSRNLYNLLHFLAIIFIISQYIELWIIRNDLELVLRNLSVTMLSTVSVVKAGSFVYWQKKWRNIVNFVKNIEEKQLKKRDVISEKILEDYKKYSRKITFFYWGLTAASAVTFILTPLISFLSSAEYRISIRNGTRPYPEIISSWTPFNRTHGYGYVATLVLHSLLSVYGGCVLANYDTNVVVLMSFFCGQLNLLKANCKRLFDRQKDYAETIDNIAECHKHHILLVRYANILDSVVSPVLFLYVIISSLMICASAIQITSEGVTSMQQVWIAEYIGALIFQLFMYCWHSNQVFDMSLNVNAGIYESKWISQQVGVRRCVTLLAGQLNKNIIFSAGPFTKLSISTFLTIIKGSYSYYTILSKK